MTEKRKKSTKPIPVATAPDNGDQISDLPVEIQHKILQNLYSHKHAARTGTLSKRWRSVWRSYPDVVFDEDINADGQRFQNFVESEFRRLSLDNQFKMQTLDVTILGFDSEPFRSPALEQLLSLASEKKATKVAVNVPSGYVRLPYRLLSNSGVESLNLTGIKLDSGNDDSSSPLSLNSLRSLYMENFHMDESFFTNLIASCPLLRILQIETICNMRKLKVSKATNLRTFLIHSLASVEEIEIEAPGLAYLQIIGGDSLIKLELVAPQLKQLHIYDAELTGRVLTAVVSKVPSLEYLSLRLRDSVGKKLKLWSPNLKVFDLLASTSELEEIQIDAGPSLSKFFLRNQMDLPCNLQKCEMNGSVACRWEAEFMFYNLDEESPKLLYLGEMRRLFARYPQFRTVSINVSCLDKVTFEEEPVADQTALPAIIDHLILRTDMQLEHDQKVILKAVFWICRPKFFTVRYMAQNSKEFFRTLLNLMSSDIWRDELKKGCIVAGDANEMEMMRSSKDMAALLATKKQVRFFLTWHSLVPLTD